ncbi:MAG: hypothetical protein JNN00_12070 [Chitinophagaceae bacterium]|nr:hypothetical protein [Chitinophagaceae bacterium]
MNKTYPGIKLLALGVKQLQIIFLGQFPLQVVKENAGETNRLERVALRCLHGLDILYRNNAALRIKIRFSSVKTG